MEFEAFVRNNITGEMDKMTTLEMNKITGHIMDLSADEWLEACVSYIASARTYIARARKNHFGRDYLLMKAEIQLNLAEKCRAESIIAQSTDDFF